MIVIPAKAGIRFLVALAMLFVAATAFAAPLKVVATTPDLASLAMWVGRDAVDVSFLVPAGVDGESFQPKPQDLARLRDANVVLRVGVDYDLWFDRLLKQSGNAAIQRGAKGYIDASRDVALLDVRAGGVGPGDGHGHGRGNPHYWLDPMNGEIITGTILEALAAVDPANAKRYEANRQVFMAELEKHMHAWMRELPRPNAIIAQHDSWPYFARRFRLRFVGVIEPRPGVPPGPAHLAELAQTPKVTAIVRQPTEPARDADFLASKTGAPVVILASSVGGVPAARDYFTLIDYNVRALAKGSRKFPKPAPG